MRRIRISYVTSDFLANAEKPDIKTDEVVADMTTATPDAVENFMRNMGLTMGYCMGYEVLA